MVATSIQYMGLSRSMLRRSSVATYVRRASSMVKMMPHATSRAYSDSERSKLGTVVRKKLKTLTMMVAIIKSPRAVAAYEDLGALSIFRSRWRGSRVLERRCFVPAASATLQRFSPEASPPAFSFAFAMQVQNSSKSIWPELSESTSLTISSSSSALRFWPRVFMTSPSSLVEMVPLPSLSKAAKIFVYSCLYWSMDGSFTPARRPLAPAQVRGAQSLLGAPRESSGLTVSPRGIVGGRSAVRVRWPSEAHSAAGGWDPS